MMEINEKVDITKKIQDFSDVVAQFSDLLDEENGALRCFDMNKVSKLYAKKTQIVTSYRNLTAFLIKNRNELNSLSEEIRSNIKNSSLALDAKLKENDLLLKTRM